MEKILLTGASGLIGSECSRTLKDKYEVYHISRNDGVRCDLLDADSVKNVMKSIKPDKLLHLAWETEHGKYLNSPNNLSWPMATYNLMREFYENGGKHAVIAGTCFEYDLSFGILDEYKTPLSPNSIYGLTKKYTYELLTLYRSEMPFAWGRIFYVYGKKENENRLVPYACKNLRAGEITCCGSGEQVRDYLYVEDVAKAFLCLLEKNAEGPYNICGGKAIKIKDIVNEIGLQLGKSELIVYDYKKDRKSEPPVIIGNNERLKGLGWEQSVSVKEGIRQILIG